MTKSNARNSFICNIAALVATVGAVTVIAPVASADPSGSGDSGSGIVDGGSSIIQSCVGDPASCIPRVIDGGSSVLGTGSALLGTGSFGGPNIQSQQCNQSTQAGGPGVTDTRHELGRPGPTSFVLDYETLDVPDQIEVFYEGRLLHNTGYVGDNRNEGTGSVVINVPPGGATSVVVRVTGPGGTEWSYIVHCPF